jgi:Ca-activated chloride channel homolog
VRRSLIRSVTLMCALLTGSAQAGAWSDWWWRPDQQGQQALNRGDAKRAAQLFDDPRRRAYAELKAGDFSTAAKRLTPFDDALSQYNRGNALAHSGDLQTAMQAYDAALKHSPQNSSLHRDAQHNRDVVERQLQHQAQRSSSAQNDEQQNTDRNRQNAQAQNGSSQSSAGSQQAQQNAAKSADASGSQQAQANANQKNAKSSARQRTAESTQQANSSSAQNEAQQARQDAQAALRSQSTSSSSSNGNAQDAAAMAHAQQSNGALSNDKAGAAEDSLKPSSEQQLALEQWLRQVPDDPGGLLRRKFLIEHMIKQREAQGDGDE